MHFPSSKIREIPLFQFTESCIAQHGLFYELFVIMMIIHTQSYYYFFYFFVWCQIVSSKELTMKVADDSSFSYLDRGMELFVFSFVRRNNLHYLILLLQLSSIEDNAVKKKLSKQNSC
jgi:hypothetical protein